MGILALAGMVSGAGDGLGKAAATAGTFLSASALQKQREEMELRRMEIMEGNAAAREQRGYAHSEKLAADAQANAKDMQQETIAHAERSQARGFEHDTEKQESAQSFAKGENDKTRAEHRMDQEQARDIAERTLAQGDERLRNDKEHQAETLALARAQLEATKDKATLMPMSDGTIYRVDAQGKVVGKAIDPETGKPLQGTKDLPATTKLLVEVNKTMIQQKGEQLKNPSLLPEERNAINAEMTRLKADVENLLGRAPARSGATQIVDPFESVKAPDTMTAKNAPAKSGESAEDYLARLRAEAEQRTAAKKSTTQQAAQAAMDTENPGAVAATNPLPEQPAQPAAPPQVAKMERQKPTMQQPGEPSAPSGAIAAVKPPPPTPPPQVAALPRELPRAAAPTATASKPPMAEPDMIDPNGPPDPLVSDQAPNVPREFARATPPPTGILSAAKPPMPEPPITDPNGPPVEPEAPSAPAAKPAAQPTSRALTPKQLTNLITTDQKIAIAEMRDRVLKPGTKEKPATPGQLQNLLIKTYGPIFQANGQSPAELADFIEQMMGVLLPDRKDRK